LLPLSYTGILTTCILELSITLDPNVSKPLI
jgi:hypothetical protein